MELHDLGNYRIRRELSPEELAWYRAQEHIRQLEVFAPDRLVEDEANPASPAQANELMWQIEELCNSPFGEIAHGRAHRDLPRTDLTNKHAAPIRLSWNPAGKYGGFGAVISDGAPAKIHSLVRRDSLFHLYEENLYVSQITGEAVISAWKLFKPDSNSYRHAEKAANAIELVRISKLLDKLDADDRANQATKPELPIFLEVGYGLDPAAVIGRRKFKADSRIYLGVDPGVGNYGTPADQYGKTVRDTAARNAEIAARERPGEHTLYTLGTGSQLPVKDDSVTEILMSNVLNAPLEPGEPDQLLDEAYRSLKAAGTLVLRVNWHQDTWSHGRVYDLIKSHGFEHYHSVGPDREEYDVLDAQYGHPTNVAAPKGYYLFAYKPSPDSRAN